MITDALARGRNAVGIWQNLVDIYGFSARYASVRRFVAQLRATAAPEARVVITTAPREEGQVEWRVLSSTPVCPAVSDVAPGQLRGRWASDRLARRGQRRRQDALMPTAHHA